MDDGWTEIRIAVWSEVAAKAQEVLASKGMTVDDAIAILFGRIAKEGELPFALTAEEEHDCWVRAMVQEALDDPAADLSSEEVGSSFRALASTAPAGGVVDGSCCLATGFCEGS